MQDVVQRKKLQSTFSVSVKLGHHSYIHIWVPSSWTHRILRVLSLWAIWNVSKRTWLRNLVSD